MENARKIGRIARDESQRALAIERLETIEELARDFQVWFHPKANENQLVHFIEGTDSQRRRSNPGDGKVWRSFPDWQTADRTLFERLVGCDHSNSAGDITAGLDQEKLSRLS